MMKPEYKRNRHINPKRLMLLILIPVLLIAGGFGVYKIMAEDTYAAYNTYDESNKKEGTMEHFTEEKEDTYYLSFYYPKFDDKQLNEIVQKYRSTSIQTKRKHEGMLYIKIDYASEKLFDQYINLTFTQKLYDADEKQIDEIRNHYTYDTKQKRLISVTDALRRDYVQVVKKLAESAGIKASGIHAMRVQVEKNALMLYTGKETKGISLPYQEYKKYIRLANRNIPSLYQKDAIIPAEQKVDPNKKMIAFTFDDGPHWQNTEIIMKEFEKYNGRATFFMLGQNVKDKTTGVDHTDIVRDMYQRGFEVGNHSWDHSMRIAASKSDAMSKAEVSDEIYNTQDAIFAACGADATMFRPPYGALNSNVRAVSTLDFALWDLDTLDWSNKNADIITQNIMSNVHDGSVILLHDIHDFSKDAIIQVLPKLEAKGYQFVSLSTLRKYKNEKLVNENIVIPSSID